MFGHKGQWEPARGSVVESRIEQTTLDETPGLRQVRMYEVRIRKPSGAALRATVQSPDDPAVELSPGVAIRLEVNSETGEVRFDPSGIHGLGGAQTAESGAQAAELVQAMMAGADRTAAMENIKQPKTNIQAQTGDRQAQVGAAAGQAGAPGRGGMPGQAGGPMGSVGFSSPEAPGTFDSVNRSMPPATTFSSPADAFGTPTGSVGAPGGSVSFSSPPVAPASFETRNHTPGSPAGGSSFGTGGSYSPFGQDNKADRIARLKDQRDQGQLTEQQFVTQHQQILDES